MNKGPKVFISYTHVNVEIAEKLATDLRKNGVDAWLDKWKIKLGDSIIKKIFEEGQANCDAFIILLSKASVASSWVQHELDTAMVNRIEGLTRVIPVVVENCNIPVSLKALRWLNITTNYENGLREVIKAIFEVHEKPPIGSPKLCSLRCAKCKWFIKRSYTNRTFYVIRTGRISYKRKNLSSF